jgi:hypothetical protein
MKASAQIHSVDNISGTSTKTGNPYDLDFLSFVDLDTFDKVKLLINKDQVKTLNPLIGKKGVVSVGFDPKSERLNFLTFAAA